MRQEEPIRVKTTKCMKAEQKLETRSKTIQKGEEGRGGNLEQWRPANSRKAFSDEKVFNLDLTR